MKRIIINQVRSLPSTNVINFGSKNFGMFENVIYIELMTLIKDDDINFILKIGDPFNMWCENEKQENRKKKKVKERQLKKKNVNVILLMKLFPQNQEAA